ncbi:MAG: hypothetical protein AAB883_02260 [Patescibacteria group bacterium]
MSLIDPKTIEEEIVHFLVAGEQTTLTLLHKIDLERRGVTKQGFYAALRKLKGEEVVVVYQGRVSLNTAWIRRMQDTLATLSAAYIPTSESSDILALTEKETVSYTFSTTKHLDTFWGHTQNQIIERTPRSEAVFSYDPHYWFYVARKETEERLIEHITSENRQFLMTVGGETALDRSLKARFATDLRQYHQEKLFPRPEYYVVVIGDYLTEVVLDSRVAAMVDDIYERSTGADSITEKTLARLLTIKAKHRIKISRNARKARELKTKLGKNFFIQKS